MMVGLHFNTESVLNAGAGTFLALNLVSSQC